MKVLSKSSKRGFPLVLTALLAYLFLWPVDIQPEAWTPPAPPESTGVWAPNQELAALDYLQAAHCLGCEDVAVDSMGNAYACTVDGYLLAMTAAKSDTLLHTGGRGLGLAWDAQDRLIIADGKRGLLRYDPDDNSIETLTNSYHGTAFGLVDDVDVAPDGKIYFSDASDRWPIEELRTDFLEHGANGALYSFDPSSGTTQLLVDDGFFTNGVAVSQSGDFLLYNETSAYRIYKYYLNGPKAGQKEVLIEGLPGFPDGISRAPDGTFWLTLVYPRQKTLDYALPRPWLRKVFRRIPTAFLPKPTYVNCLIQIDAYGKVLRTLQDTDPEFHSIASVEQVGDKLYLGTLADEGYGIFDLEEN